MSSNDELPDTATGDALRSLMRDGSNLSRPMDIDFFLAVPDKETGWKIAREVRRLGYDASLEQDDENQDWTCYCRKNLVPKYSEVVRLENELDLLAKKYGGYADGFGSYGNASDVS